MAEIARVNRLNKPYVIHPGDDLLIPRPGDLSDQARARLEAEPSKPADAKVAKGAKGAKSGKNRGKYQPPDGWERVAYKVQRGDTIGGIARKLGVSVSHLKSVNAIPRSNLIRAGQRLYAYRPSRG